MNRNETVSILQQLKHSPKKKLGQNFLIDDNILNKVISEAQITTDDIVLEIGPGLGALTSQLCDRAERVYAYEIDRVLYQYLKKKYSSSKKIQLFNDDILKATIPPHNKVVSNIPYSITGPIFEKIFYNSSPPSGTLIIEESLAQRIFSKNNYKTFSRISVTFNAFMIPLEKTPISPKSFFPSPKIKLSMIKVLPKEKINPFLKSEESINFFLDFVSGIMPYKNKNLSNAILLFLHKKKNCKISKDKVKAFLASIHFNDTKLSSYNNDDFVDLSHKVFELLDIKSEGELQDK